MATRKKRKSKRRSNPAYSDAVFNIANDFIDALDKAANAGYKAAQKIQIKAGNVGIAESINRAAEALSDLSESLEDELGVED